MTPSTAWTRRAWLAGAAALLTACASPTAPPPDSAAREVRVVSSGGFTAAYKILAPLYAQASGVKIVSEYGASIGNAPDSIPSRLASGPSAAK